MHTPFGASTRPLNHYGPKKRRSERKCSLDKAFAGHRGGGPHASRCTTNPPRISQSPISTVKAINRHSTKADTHLHGRLRVLHGPHVADAGADAVEGAADRELRRGVVGLKGREVDVAVCGDRGVVHDGHRGVEGVGQQLVPGGALALVQTEHVPGGMGARVQRAVKAVGSRRGPSLMRTLAT